MPEAPQQADQFADEGNDREDRENQIGDPDDHRWYPDLNGEPELPSHPNREDPSAAFVTLRLPNVTPRSQLIRAPSMSSNVPTDIEISGSSFSPAIWLARLRGTSFSSPSRNDDIDFAKCAQRDECKRACAIGCSCRSNKAAEGAVGKRPYDGDVTLRVNLALPAKLQI